MPLFTIIVPVYQNELNLQESIARLFALQELLPHWELEYIFIDDGSFDNSFKLLKTICSSIKLNAQILKLSRNFGQTSAIQAGLSRANGDCVGIISADLQEPCETFVSMIKAWEDGNKFVIARRESRAEGWFHRKVSNIYWKLIAKFIFTDFPDDGYDFCLIDKKIAESINLINEKNTSIFILIYWLGYKPVYKPIHRELRTHGKSQWTLFKKLKLTIDTLIGFTYLPSRLITLLSLTTSLISLIYFIYLLINWKITGTAPPGWMTVVALILLLGTAILFSLGIISEYLLRILDETRKRPAFIIESITNYYKK